MYVVVQNVQSNVPYFNETKPNTNECSKSELKSLIKPTISPPHANKLWWMPLVPGCFRVQVVTSAVKRSIGSTNGFHNYGEGLLLVESAY